MPGKKQSNKNSTSAKESKEALEKNKKFEKSKSKATVTEKPKEKQSENANKKALPKSKSQSRADALNKGEDKQPKKTKEKEKQQKKEEMNASTGEVISKNDLSLKTSKSSSSTKKAIKKEGVSPRKRKTSRINKSQRRLQEYAALLRGESECVAVMFHDDMFYIASNEGNASKTLFKDLSSYFLTLKDKADPEMRKALLIRICESGYKDLHKSMPDGLAKSVVDVYLKEKRPDIHAFVRDWSAHGLEAAAAFGGFQPLYRAFRKIEKMAKSSNPAFLVAKQVSFIEKVMHEKKPVHAEMRLLEKLVSLLDQGMAPEGEVFIGISKLCCTHCYEMIQAANELFVEEGLSISIRIEGTHNLSFPDNWGCPKDFKTGYNAYSKREDKARSTTNKTTTEVDEKIKVTMGYRIGYLGREKIHNALQKKAPSGVSQLREGSSSDATSAESKKRHVFKEKMEVTSEMLSKFPSDWTIERCLKALELGLKICGDDKLLTKIRSIFSQEKIELDEITTSILKAFKIEGDVGFDMNVFLKTKFFTEILGEEDSDSGSELFAVSSNKNSFLASGDKTKRQQSDSDDSASSLILNSV